jgi:hypothetical protein
MPYGLIKKKQLTILKKIDKPAKRKIRMIFVNPFEKDPDETYRAYQRFRKRNEYDKAYSCIENLLKRFPDDMELLDEIVALALGPQALPARG